MENKVTLHNKKETDLIIQLKYKSYTLCN